MAHTYTNAIVPRTRITDASITAVLIKPIVDPSRASSPCTVFLSLCIWGRSRNLSYVIRMMANARATTMMLSPQSVLALKSNSNIETQTPTINRTSSDRIRISRFFSAASLGSEESIGYIPRGKPDVTSDPFGLYCCLR